MKIIPIFQTRYDGYPPRAGSLLLVTIILLFFSCSKDSKDPIPIPLEPAEQAGIGIEQALQQFNAYQQYIALDSAILKDDKDSIVEIPVSAALLNAKDIVSEDIPLTFMVDNSLVETFNVMRSKTNGATYSRPFPEDALLQASLASLLKQGNKRSDTVVFRINTMRLASAGSTFVLPLKLVRQDGTGNPMVNSNYQIAYYVFNIYDTPTADLLDITDTKTALYSIEAKEAGNSSPALISFKGVISNISPKAVKLVVEANSQLIHAYNQQNGSRLKQLPEQAYRLVTDNVTIPAGSKLSAENLQLEIVDPALLVSGESYLLPIQVKTSQHALVDQNKGVLYVKILINNIDSKNTGLTGTPIDRTKWSVSVSSAYGNGIGNMMLDGKNNTAWTSNSATTRLHEVLLDMGINQTVKGFSITPNYIYIRENITKMKISSSLDGTTWQLQGMYSGAVAAGSISNPDIKMVRFLSPVKGRYFRFEITESGTSSYTGIGELNAIQ